MTTFSTTKTKTNKVPGGLLSPIVPILIFKNRRYVARYNCQCRTVFSNIEMFEVEQFYGGKSTARVGSFRYPQKNTNKNGEVMEIG